MGFLRKVFIAIILLALFFGLVWYCANKIDKKRAEEKERKEKIDEGMCEFDKLDLQKLRFYHYKRSFGLDIVQDSIEKLFREQVKFTTCYDSLPCFKIDHASFLLKSGPKGNVIKYVDMSRTALFEFRIGDQVVIKPSDMLNDFRENYPKSYACRDNQPTSWRTEQYAIRIDNNNFNNSLQCMIIYFNHAENIDLIELIYDFEIN